MISGLLEFRTYHAFQGNPSSCLLLYRQVSLLLAYIRRFIWITQIKCTGPAELSEHPSYRPIDGGWLWKEVVDAIVSSPKYNKTILIISYDETGGWGDQYVIPRISYAALPGY